MKLSLILLAFAWLAILDVTVALYDPFAIATKHHHREQGGVKGKAYSATKKGKKYSSKKGYKKKGKTHSLDKEDAANGQKGFALHKMDDHENAGKRSKYFTDDFFHDYGHEHGGGSHGGHFKKGGKRKNRKYSKGFREKYSKNEHKKSSSFYSKGNKSGDYKIFGEESTKSGNDTGDKYAGGTKHSAHEEDHWGKQKGKEKGHDLTESKGYTKKDGKKKHYSKGKKYSKKSSKSKSGKKKAKANKKYKPH